MYKKWDEMTDEEKADAAVREALGIKEQPDGDNTTEEE
jgi:hypothetical protein